jgi:hypothetical protein
MIRQRIRDYDEDGVRAIALLMDDLRNYVATSTMAHH